MDGTQFEKLDRFEKYPLVRTDGPNKRKLSPIDCYYTSSNYKYNDMALKMRGSLILGMVPTTLLKGTSSRFS